MAVEEATMGTISPWHVTTPDGRTLEAWTFGPEDGEVLVSHHGTPGVGLPYRPQVEAAVARDLRIVCYSRPGYGASTTQPGRRVVDAAADVAAILDALGVSTFRTVGASGGGPHALACRAALPDRCLAAVSIAGVAPYPAEGLDWFDGMGPENVEEFGLALLGADALTPFLEQFAGLMQGITAADLAESMGGLLSDVDKAHATGEFAEHLLESFQLALANGIGGQRDDDLAFTRDWGFDPAGLTSVAVWQGAQDRMVPYGHGVWLAEHIPAARRRLFDDEGHLSLGIGRFDQILDDLLTL